MEGEEQDQGQESSGQEQSGGLTEVPAEQGSPQEQQPQPGHSEDQPVVAPPAEQINPGQANPDVGQYVKVDESGEVVQGPGVPNQPVPANEPTDEHGQVQQ